jgi:hypothetical protein
MDYKTMYERLLQDNDELLKVIDDLKTRNKSLKLELCHSKKSRQHFLRKASELKKSVEETDERQKEMWRNELFGRYHILKDICRNANRKPKGRCYTEQERIFYINLYLAGPKALKISRLFLPAPAPNTVKGWINDIGLCSGINEAVMQAIEKIGNTMERSQKVVSLSFDATGLTEHLIYNSKSDSMIGFIDKLNKDENEIEEDTETLANSVMCFVIKGISVSFTQLVAYYFCDEKINETFLEHIIQRVCLRYGITDYL